MRVYSYSVISQHNWAHAKSFLPSNNRFFIIFRIILLYLYLCIQSIMITALLIGIVLGLTLSVSAGPIMLMIVKTSLERERKQAAFFASGVWLSDCIYATLTYIGVNWISQMVYNPLYRDKVSFIGAMVLLIFGIGIIFRKAQYKRKFKRLRKRDLFKLFFKGFVLNSFNPFTIIFWLGISGGVVAHQITSGLDAGILYLGLIGTVILADIVKIVLADKLSKLLKAHVISRIRMAAGVIMLLCGVFLLYKTFF